MRQGTSYWVFVVHRISGIALALFLPLHFWALGNAIAGETELNGFLSWAEQPLVRAAEWAIVLALAAHLGCGLRVLALEFLPWRDWQKGLAAIAGGLTLASGLMFAMALF